MPLHKVAVTGAISQRKLAYAKNSEGIRKQFGVSFHLQFNLPYVIEEPQSADLQPLAITRSF
jgi:hypothetical protein